MAVPVLAGVLGELLQVDDLARVEGLALGGGVDRVVDRRLEARAGRPPGRRRRASRSRRSTARGRAARRRARSGWRPSQCVAGDLLGDPGQRVERRHDLDARRAPSSPVTAAHPPSSTEAATPATASRTVGSDGHENDSQQLRTVVKLRSAILGPVLVVNRFRVPEPEAPAFRDDLERARARWPPAPATSTATSAATSTTRRSGPWSAAGSTSAPTAARCRRTTSSCTPCRCSAGRSRSPAPTSRSSREPTSTSSGRRSLG